MTSVEARLTLSDRFGYRCSREDLRADVGGYPLLRQCRGGKDGGTHSPGEWFDPADAYLGPQRIFLTIIGLVGLEGVSPALLPRKK